MARYPRLLAPVVALAACYTYQPIAAPAPRVGSRISVQLSDDGSRTLGGQIGPDVLHVEGNVLDVDSGALSLSVRQVENGHGIQNAWNGERVAVPRRFVVGIQQRRLSTGGTALLGGVAGLAMFALYRMLGGGGLFEGNSGSGNPVSHQ